MNIEIVG